MVRKGNMVREGNMVRRTIKIRQIADDHWGRKRYRNTEHDRIYADVDGVLYTTSRDGEPSSPLRTDINIIHVKVQLKIVRLIGVNQYEEVSKKTFSSWKSAESYREKMSDKNGVLYIVDKNKTKIKKPNKSDKRRNGRS